MFDSMQGLAICHPGVVHPDRYHLTLTADGRPTMHGWWGSETTARRKFSAWTGEHGRTGARITLVDEETGATLTTWPDET